MRDALVDQYHAGDISLNQLLTNLKPLVGHQDAQEAVMNLFVGISPFGRSPRLLSDIQSADPVCEPIPLRGVAARSPRVRKKPTFHD